MYAWDSDNNYGGITAMEERMKIMYNEHVRSPTHTVAHYISYLRRYVSQTEGQRSPASDRSLERTTNLAPGESQENRPINAQSSRSSDSMSPLSYFIRKLKLDLKMSYPSFVEEFIQAPNNGLRLLLSLLKTLQAVSLNPTGSLHRSSTHGTLKMDNYKQNMVDEQDCLLCIKYTLRIRAAVDEILEHNSGLFTVTTCLLSNFSRSRIAALEILTLIMTGPSSVDKVLEAFTSMRITYSESTRFKMLINMMHTRGVSQVLFQVSCLRLLNTILNLSKSANMRVFLQYEMEEAGLDWKRIQEGAKGDGLEFDDLRKEIHEWKMRYIDVDTILRKIKADLRGEVSSSALLEFNYDQHFGPKYRTAAAVIAECQAKSSPVSLWAEYGHEKHSTPEQTMHWPAHSSKTAEETQNKYDNRNSEKPLALSTNHRAKTNLSNINGRNMARTPSPAAPESANSRADISSVVYESKAVKNSKSSAVSREIYDPYGLLIKTRSSDHNSSHSGTEDKNWVFEKPDVHVDLRSSNKKHANKSHQLPEGQRVRQKASIESGIYDSGICVDSGDTEPDDQVPVHFIEKAPPVTKIRTSPMTSECYIGTDGGSKGRPASYKVDTGNDDLNNGLLRWYNPTPFSSKPSSEAVEQNHTSGYQNGKVTKPRTPTPDYENDWAEDTDRPFSPSQSSTMKANVKATIVRTLNRGFNGQHSNNNMSTRNSNYHISREDLRDSNYGDQQRSVFARRDPDSCHVSPSPMFDTYKDKERKINENDISSPSQSSSSFQLKTSPQTTSVKQFKSSPQTTSVKQFKSSPQTTSVKQRMNASGHAPSADSDRGYQPRGHDSALSPSSRSTSTYTDHHLDVSMGSYCPQYTRRGASETPTSQREHSHLKTSMLGNEKHMSRSMISLTANDIETDASRNTIQNKFANNAHGSRRGSRRLSVSEQKPTHESVRRNSLVIVTSFTNINTNPEDSSTQKSSSNGVDSMRSYSAEIGRVLSDLDLALEKHGWQATLKTHQKQLRPPLIAYI